MHIHIRGLQTRRELRFPWSQFTDSPVRNSDLVRKLRPRARDPRTCPPSHKHISAEAALLPRGCVAPGASSRGPTGSDFRGGTGVEVLCCSESLMLCRWGWRPRMHCFFPVREREREVAQSCPTPSNPMDCSPPGSSVHGIFQTRVLEWGAVAFSIFPQMPVQLPKQYCEKSVPKGFLSLHGVMRGRAASVIQCGPSFTTKTQQYGLGQWLLKP